MNHMRYSSSDDTDDVLTFCSNEQLISYFFNVTE